ncbi:hypothetical protein ODZ84_06775 [Chryseobacterium fluminis]|uniref:hypothetical protein n=1 Tax=Chryseobacterium fluminis TaxID=2983606 RepID=UPI002256D39F|nr:hypothetical protein [Chryseobacterium sp. MMS21-Ot14]UZT99269.1 hypothetical protein ODZ84_06775 [Chryseobacterium sp. MMS21-Ot14]
MIRKILLGTFCIAQLSVISAKESGNIHSHPVSSEYFQKAPKTVIIKTKKFKIKLDLQPNGQYLYQSWNANAKVTSKPSMIISNGDLIPDGTGGNYYYEFSNDGYTYQVWRNYLTTSANKAPYTLVVMDQNGKTIANQDGWVVKN